jgi:signal transduction histidine kinase
VAALESQARKAAVPVEIHADEVGRYSPDLEATVYFCTLEALQNVAKYAQASRTVVRLEDHDAEVAFSVTDDGRGFDPGITAMGTGLQGMTDRVAAVGGTLEVRSAPGQGTTLRGRIPKH